MKYLFASLISILFFVLTYSSAPDEFRRVDLGIISILLLMVLGLQCLIGRFLARLPIAQNVLLAIFVTFNIVYTNLILNSIFAGLPFYYMVGALLVSLFIISTLLNMFDDYPKVCRMVSMIIALMIVGILAQVFISTPPASELTRAKKAVKAENVRMVDFRDSPDVYFVSFDSLIPRSLLKKHLNLETTAYHDVLEAAFRPYTNFFADRVSTRNSLNSLLSLDIRHFSDPAMKKVKGDFFAGLIPSPLFDVFKHNGYETNTLYSSPYFGRVKGPYVDNYFRPVQAFYLQKGACEFIDVRSYKAPTFFGYCSLLKSKLLRQTLKSLGIGVPEKQDPIDFLLDQMRNGIESGKPQVFLAYIYSPGHTSKDFRRENVDDFEAYRKKYLASSEDAAEQIKKLISFIDQENEDAIVYVFGDHGPWLSRDQSLESNPSFFVQDRYGIYGGIYPESRCAPFFEETNEKPFTTILQGAHMIIKCLSGGVSPMLTEQDYTLPFAPEFNRYGDYLYE